GALKQLQQYALALESPPLLIVSDIDTIEIHTAFQNAVQDVHIVRLRDLVEPSKLSLLRSAFKDPERLRPQRTRDQVTKTAAGQFAELAFALRADGRDPQIVAHFLNKILFCMFAEDVGILKSNLFTDIVEKGVQHPEHFNTFVQRLFQAMQSGGPFGTEIIDWFNGGLFDDDVTLPLTLSQIRTLRNLSRMDWSQIEPAIFGTLFERGLDPDKRSQLGAHYTDPESIMRLVNPTIVDPLLAEWREVRAEIASQMERLEKVKTKSATAKRRQAANNAFQSFLERLRNFRIFDPACGSGNFLYLSLQALKNIEHRANIEAEALGLHKQNPLVGPEAVLGIEINAYAAELARVTIWIGEIQWMLNHGYSLSTNPILKPLENIEQRDALLNEDDTESEWPSADVIVGNPPFLGNKKLIAELGENYVARVRNLFKGRLPGGVDLVMYWFEKAGSQIAQGKADRFGLVATNSIRAGSNRKVIQKILEKSVIYEAWADEPWINDGAAVRVSLLCIGDKYVDGPAILNGTETTAIRSDLTGDNSVDGTKADLTLAAPLYQNDGVAFQGVIKVGKFDIEGKLARKWLALPTNPNGRTNRDVVRPWLNGIDVARRPRDMWLLDFGLDLAEKDAALYEAPFEYAVREIKEDRAGKREARSSARWWIHHRPRPEMRAAIEGLRRFILTPRVSKHRIFVWAPSVVIPDSRLYAIAREDDVSFGILHSRIHEVWSLGTCSWHGAGNDPTYNAISVFGTFPFPLGLTPNIAPKHFDNPSAEAIAAASRRLCELRENWLNPPEWVDRVPEVVPGLPLRIVAKEGHEDDLNKRTLTNLYNQRPAWLENVHNELNEAVAAAYNWPANLTDDQILANLLALNRAIAADGRPDKT
ncbi:MAG: N-6 DNA methylase, partial [Woeseiaceae bacterium]